MYNLRTYRYTSMYLGNDNRIVLNQFHFYKQTNRKPLLLIRLAEFRRFAPESR
jgi:hypothetical protein